ncbi:MAG TPA: pyridoxamine 5'-phosphate oxidase family protein [Acidimicrobiales bacterium]
MKRRDLIRMSDDEVRELLDGRHTMNVATVNHDGSIHLVAMWYGFLDGKPAFWTYGRSQKILNLERNPQITCLVESGEVYEELQGVELVGRAEIVRDRDRLMEIGRSVFNRYIGTFSEEMQPYLDKTGAKRVGVVIDVERTVSWDHRKLGGTY